MTKLSFIDSEARRHLKRLSEDEIADLQKNLILRCKEHWHEIRGPEPTSPLAHLLWTIPPPLADLYVDMYASGGGVNPVSDLAALVFAEIERGNLEGIHVAYEAMMILETFVSGRVYAKQIARALRGELPPIHLHRHSPREPFWKALAIITSYAGRFDSKAVFEVIRLLASSDVTEIQNDKSLDQLRQKVLHAGVRFLRIEDDSIYVEVHGHSHKPVSRKHMTDLSEQIRHMVLAKLG